MEHKEGIVKGGKTLVTTSLAGILAYLALPYLGYSNDVIDPVVYTGVTAAFAGAIKYLRGLANQFLAVTGINIIR